VCDAWEQLVDFRYAPSLGCQSGKADWDAVGAVEDGVVTNLEALAARYGDFAGAASGTQTNEVGRLATLMPAFATVASESQPLALLEVGASTGLCLYPDRYDYDWRPVGRLTGSDGPELRCDVTGPMALPIAPIDVRWRGGIDLNPLQLTDDDAMAWLSIVWPEQINRRERLVGAIIIARQDPPQLVAGNFLDLLPTQIHAASEHGQVVVFHSAVIAYLNDQDRRTFSTLMRGLVDDGACRWVSNEAEDVLPDITRTAPSVR
jgi:hypothetical protein